MLEYDNSAFYYFTLSLISIYLVPVTLAALQQVRVNFSRVPLLPGRCNGRECLPQLSKTSTTGRLLLHVRMMQWSYSYWKQSGWGVSALTINSLCAAVIELQFLVAADCWDSLQNLQPVPDSSTGIVPGIQVRVLVRVPTALLQLYVEMWSCEVRRLRLYTWY